VTCGIVVIVVTGSSRDILWHRGYCCDRFTWHLVALWLLCPVVHVTCGGTVVTVVTGSLRGMWWDRGYCCDR
jgi:hypothetical protein